MQAEIGTGELPMLLRGLSMNIVAAQARYGCLALNDHIADIIHHVPIDGTQVPYCSFGEVGFEITEEIVPSYKIVWIR